MARVLIIGICLVGAIATIYVAGAYAGYWPGVAELVNSDEGVDWDVQYIDVSKADNPNGFGKSTGGSKPWKKRRRGG